MKLHILSDVHTEFNPYNPPKTDADVVVLAGDIGNGLAGLTWARNAFPEKTIIYVPGNHEFYGAHLQRTCVEMRAYAEELNINYLDNDSTIIGGVRFIGSILWTDFELFGPGEMLGQALRQARYCINDFNCIRYGSTGWMLPEQTVIMHRAAREFIEHELKKPFYGPTVVVTHHAPSIKSAAPRYQHDILSAAFASNLEHLVPMADLWVHGHMHSFAQYNLGSDSTKGHVVCNPRGYENVGFREVPSNWNKRLILEV